MKYNLRNSSEDLFKRMQTTLLPGTVMPIHRTTSSRVLLEAGEDMLRLFIPKFKGITVNVIDPTVILECKDGEHEP